MAFERDCLHVQGLKLWSHVGVLPFEQLEGQWFELDLRLGLDCSAIASSDALVDTLDYSQLIAALQRQALELRCQTIEAYSERILELIETLYGPMPIHLQLRKCHAPVPGFDGLVAIERYRRW
jgi:dihydroneopterin aldolase